MIRFNHVLIVATISLLTLAGCNSTEQTNTQTSPTVSPASSVDAVGVKTSKGGFDGLLGVVSNTKAAVESGDFAKAKTEFDKFEDFWKTVEDGVKAKSPDSYKAIEDSMDNINGELKASKPSKEKVLARLQSLEKNITGVAKS